MAYQDLEFRCNLWDQFGIGLQSLTEQWGKRKMSEEKDKALDELVSWAEVACEVLEQGQMPSANTIKELRAATDAAWNVNDYKKGEPI